MSNVKDAIKKGRMKLLLRREVDFRSLVLDGGWCGLMIIISEDDNVAATAADIIVTTIGSSSC